MNVEILGTIKARMLKLSIVSRDIDAHKAHKPPKTATHTFKKCFVFFLYFY